MQAGIKAHEDENFKIIKKSEETEIVDDCHISSATPEQIAEQPIQPEPSPKRREPTLNNQSGHEWFNGTSWGLK